MLMAFLHSKDGKWLRFESRFYDCIDQQSQWCSSLVIQPPSARVQDEITLGAVVQRVINAEIETLR